MKIFPSLFVFIASLMFILIPNKNVIAQTVVEFLPQSHTTEKLHSDSKIALALYKEIEDLLDVPASVSFPDNISNEEKIQRVNNFLSLVQEVPSLKELREKDRVADVINEVYSSLFYYTKNVYDSQFKIYKHLMDKVKDLKEDEKVIVFNENAGDDYEGRYKYFQMLPRYKFPYRPTIKDEVSLEEINNIIKKLDENRPLNIKEKMMFLLVGAVDMVYFTSKITNTDNSIKILGTGGLEVVRTASRIGNGKIKINDDQVASIDELGMQSSNCQDFVPSMEQIKELYFNLFTVHMRDLEAIRFIRSWIRENENSKHKYLVVMGGAHRLEEFNTDQLEIKIPNAFSGEKRNEGLPRTKITSDDLIRAKAQLKKQVIGS
ncbi:MAG: hypothetical protein HQK52_23955 [Oligoflexia bacterium]|nr:hypothetical protein [Oligoflexia bacterium]